MITENLSTLKIHRLTQQQYDRELAAGRIDETAIYLTPDEEIRTPIKGVDYWTEDDKAEIIQEVLDQIDQLGIGSNIVGEVDSENNILITAALPAGTYTMRYENVDGSTIEIGTFTISGEPAMINLANPKSSEWMTNKRINSSGSLVDVTEAQRGSQTVVITNKIPISGVTKLHIKGLDIMSALTASSNNYGRYYVYLSDGTLKSWQLQPSVDALKSYFTTADYDSSVTVVDVQAMVKYVGVGYDQSHVRLGGILTGTAEDVIITADQKIQ